jgi:hypothetical protein
MDIAVLSTVTGGIGYMGSITSDDEIPALANTDTDSDPGIIEESDDYTEEAEEVVWQGSDDESDDHEGLGDGMGFDDAIDPDMSGEHKAYWSMLCI